MIEKQDVGLSTLRMLLGAISKATANTDIMLEDIIPNPVDSVEDLNKLSSHLDDQEFTNKMVSIPTISDIEIRDTYIKKTFFNIFMENSPVNPLPPLQCCYFGPKNHWLHHTKQ